MKAEGAASTQSSVERNGSLDAIARDYGRTVSSICRRMITDEEAARDAVRHVWTEIVESFPSFHGESKISTWVYAISRRVAADFDKNEKTRRFPQGFQSLAQ